MFGGQGAYGRGAPASAIRIFAISEHSDPWGIGVFDVNPGRFPGDKTSMTFTFYLTPAATAANPYPAPVEYYTFTATRTRSDGFGFRERG